MADVTALRDALLRTHERGDRMEEGWFPADDGDECYACGDWCDASAKADALIAAVEARAAITPERLAKALHETGLGCWSPREFCADAMRGNPLNDLHTPAAVAVLAALDADG